MANLIDEELCIITIILNEETDEQYKKTPKRRKWTHEAWQLTIRFQLFYYFTPYFVFI